MSWENIIKRKRWDDEKPDMSRYYGKPWAERQKEKEDQKKEKEDEERQKKESMARNPKGRALLILQEAEKNSKKLEEEYRGLSEYPYLLEFVSGLHDNEIMDGFYRFGIESIGLPFANNSKNKFNEKIEEVFFKQNYVSLSSYSPIKASVESVSLISEKIDEVYYNSEFYSTLDYIEELLKQNKEMVEENIFTSIVVNGKVVTTKDEPMPDEQKSILNNIIVRLIENVDLYKGDFEKTLRQYEKEKNELLTLKHKKAIELDTAKKLEAELRSEFRKK